jgi:hypothetical protein
MASSVSPCTALQTHGNFSPAKHRLDEIMPQQKLNEHEPLAALLLLFFYDLDSPTVASA